MSILHLRRQVAYMLYDNDDEDDDDNGLYGHTGEAHREICVSELLLSAQAGI